MSKLLIAATETVSPDKKKVTAAQTIAVESDKIVVLPREGTTKALILANGWQFSVDAEVAEIAAAMGTTNASTYT